MSKYETKQRKLLLEYLENNLDKEVSAKDVVEALANAGISKSSVYRNLAELESEGSVNKVTRAGERGVFYRYSPKECKSHLHLSCFRCGKTFHLDVPATDTLIREVNKNSDFRVDPSSTVLYGVCKDCGVK